MGKEKKEYAPTLKDIEAFESVTTMYSSNTSYGKVVYNLKNPDNKVPITKKEMESVLYRLDADYLGFLKNSDEKNVAAKKVYTYLLKRYTLNIMQKNEDIEDYSLKNIICSIGEVDRETRDASINEWPQEKKDAILLKIEEKITKLDETQDNNNYYGIIIFLLILATFLIASALLTGSPFTAFSILGSWLK